MTTDPYELARAEEMLRGYSARWFSKPMEVLAVEVEFDGPLLNPETGCASKTFRLGGKMDALVRLLPDRRVAVVEHKSSSEDISRGSWYWKRLRLNPQLPTYLLGARALGYEPDEILFDVLGKPGQRPSNVPVLDAEGCRQVFDKEGQRVRTKDGKKWRETVDSSLGYTMLHRPETPDEYRIRVRDAICADPDKFFVRGTVVRLQNEEREAAFDSWQTAHNIRESRRLGHHPRNPDSCMRYGAPCAMFDVCTGETTTEDASRYRLTSNMHEELSLSKSKLPLLTSSEMGTYRACARLHHYRYDMGVRSIVDADAARFGTLIHLGLEGWWVAKKAGLDGPDCLGAALENMSSGPQVSSETSARKSVSL